MSEHTSDLRLGMYRSKPDLFTYYLLLITYYLLLITYYLFLDRASCCENVKQYPQLNLSIRHWIQVAKVVGDTLNNSRVY